MKRLPNELFTYTGAPLAIREPEQGCNYEVLIVETAQGRYTAKRGKTPVLVAELEAESRVLEAVAGVSDGLTPRPVARAGDWFLFTYQEGEPLTAVRRNLDDEGRHRLAAEFGRTLRRVHSWQPAIAAPADSLDEALAQGPPQSGGRTG